MSANLVEKEQLLKAEHQQDGVDKDIEDQEDKASSGSSEPSVWLSYRGRPPVMYADE